MTIEQRVEKLEKELSVAKRRNRYLLAAAGLVALAVGLLAWGFGKDVRANRFVLEDANGKTRAVLSATEDGAQLVLSDARGKVRTGLSVLKDGPVLTFVDEKGNLGAALGVVKGGPSLILSDEKGKNRIRVAVGKDGPVLELLDAKGKKIWSAPQK